MSTIALTRPAAQRPQVRAQAADSVGDVTFGRVVRAEWIKLRTLRSSWLGLAAAALMLLAFAAIFAYTTSTATSVAPEDALPESPLQGYLLVQLIIGVLGASFVTSEYATGMIKATFAAVPTRLPVLAAKAGVLGAVGVASMTVMSVLAFLLAQPILGSSSQASLEDGTVLRAVLGAGVYLGLVALIGTASGWIIRSTAGAIGALTALLFVVPGLATLLPESFQGVTKYLPSNAGQALMSTVPTDALLTPAVGLGVLGLWIAVPLAVAAVLVRRRDV